MAFETRKMTMKILDGVEQGILDPVQMLTMALNWLSESEVAEMCQRNDLFEEEEEEEEDLLDNFNYVGSRHHY